MKQNIGYIHTDRSHLARRGTAKFNRDNCKWSGDRENWEGLKEEEVFFFSCQSIHTLLFKKKKEFETQVGAIVTTLNDWNFHVQGFVWVIWRRVNVVGSEKAESWSLPSNHSRETEAKRWNFPISLISVNVVRWPKHLTKCCLNHHRYWYEYLKIFEAIWTLYKKNIIEKVWMRSCN